MKKLAFLLVFAMAFALMGGLALAAETPHGPFDDNTELCAACHRAHTALSEYLVAKTEVTTLCTACHSGGFGADCDVVNGIYVNNGTFTHRTTLSGATLVGATTVSITSAGTSFANGDQIIIDPDAPANVETATIISGGGTTTLTVAALTNAHNSAVFVGDVTSSSPDHANWGTAGTALMGGGFNAVNSVATTSKHFTPDATGSTYWKIQFGNGAAPGVANAELDCVSCHLPHRSSNYRMLRQSPEGYAGTALKVADLFTRDGTGAITGSHKYTVDTGRFNLALPSVSNNGISQWCGSCHNYYFANSDHDSGNAAPAVGAGMTAAAGYYNVDGVAGADQTYMHATDVDMVYRPRNGSTGTSDLTLYANLGSVLASGLNANKLPVYDDINDGGVGAYSVADKLSCLTCHRAHGSEASMSGNARLGVKTRLGATSTGAENMADSMLLRLNNRGVCETCHNMPTGY